MVNSVIGIKDPPPFVKTKDDLPATQYWLADSGLLSTNPLLPKLLQQRIPPPSTTAFTHKLDTNDFSLRTSQTLLSTNPLLPKLLQQRIPPPGTTAFTHKLDTNAFSLRTSHTLLSTNPLLLKLLQQRSPPPSTTAFTHKLDTNTVYITIFA